MPQALAQEVFLAPDRKTARPRGRPSNNAAASVPEERVLDLAFRSFAQRGYEGTTLRQLAKQLGVSHNLLNVRFGSKEDLWRRAVDARIASIGAPVYVTFDIPGLDDSARLRELIRRFCLWAAANPEFVALTHAESRRSTWRLDHLVDAHILPFKRRLESLLANIAGSRPVGEISTSALMAILVQGVGSYFASGPLLDRIDPGHASGPEAVERQVQLFTHFILAGVLAEPSINQR